MVFISHSRGDPNLDFFHKVFSGLKTKAVWMEFEDIKPPPYQSIKNFVNQSDAVFVLLSEPLLRKLHTASWISFEIGLAANWQSPYILPRLLKDRIDVYVFEPYQQPIDYAVPYCTYYMLYNGTIEELKFLRQLIERAPLHGMGVSVKCPYENCKIEFKLLSDITEFRCPSCRRRIYLTD